MKNRVVLIDPDGNLAQRLSTLLKRKYKTTLITSNDQEELNLATITGLKFTGEILKIIYVFPELRLGCRDAFWEKLKHYCANSDLDLIGVEVGSYCNFSSKDIFVKKKISRNQYDTKQLYFDIVLLTNELDHIDFVTPELERIDHQAKVYLVDDIYDVIFKAEKYIDSENAGVEISEILPALADIQKGISNPVGNRKAYKIASSAINQKYCSLNPIYQLQPESQWRGASIAKRRLNLGQLLADKIIEKKLDIDMIVPIPETGKYYAQGIANRLGLPYVEAIFRTKGSERGLQIQDSFERQTFIRRKLNIIPDLIKDKKIGLVDEAIFTGTTLKIVVEMLYEVGANKISILIPTPYNVRRCEYNVQPERKILLDYWRRDKLKEYFDVDLVQFSDIKSLVSELKQQEILCNSCFGD